MPGFSLFFFFICCVCLSLCLVASWLFNKLARRPVMNGAAVFFWLLLLAILALSAYQSALPVVTEKMAYYAGKSIAVVLPVLAVAFVLMRRFERRVASSPAVARQMPNHSVNRTSLSALRALRSAGYRRR